MTPSAVAVTGRLKFCHPPISIVVSEPDSDTARPAYLLKLAQGRTASVADQYRAKLIEQFKNICSQYDLMVLAAQPADAARWQRHHLW